MKIFKYILFIIVSSILLQSCEDVVPVDIEDGSEFIVIEGQITNQPGPHTVKVTRNSPYFEQGITPRVENATVIINDVESDPTLGNSVTLAQSSPGIYQTDSNFQGEIGKTYYLSVTVDGRTYRASDYLAPVEVIDSVQIKLRNSYDRMFGVFVFGWETPGIGQYYKFDIYLDNVQLNEPEFLIVVDDKFVDGNYIHDFEIYNDKWYHYGEEEYALLQPGVEVFVTSSSISKMAHDFFLQLQSIATNSGLMFDPPPANPPGNIDNGGFGLFYASAVSTTPTVIVPELP